MEHALTGPAGSDVVLEPGQMVTEDGEVVEQAIPGVLTATSLTLPPGLPRKRWVRVGQSLRAMERGIQFWVGDWLAFGEAHYGEEAFAELERSDKTLANWATVARNVHPSRRRESLGFSHHAEVASLPPDEQDEVLTKAEEEDWTVRETREHVESRRSEKQEEEYGRAQVVSTTVCPTCHGSGEVVVER